MEECNPQSPFGIFVDTKTPTRVEKKVSFVTSDNETVEISRNLCNLSGTMKNILDVVEENRTIPLPNVSAPILKKIVEFMVKYDRLSADETSAMDITEEASGCDSVSHKKVTAWEVEYTDIDLKMLSQLMMVCLFTSVIAAYTTHRAPTTWRFPLS